MISKLLMLVPMVAYWKTGDITGNQAIWAIAFMLFMLRPNNTRGQRTPRHVMFLRAVWITAILLFPLSYWSANEVRYTNSYWTIDIWRHLATLYVVYGILSLWVLLVQGAIFDVIFKNLDWDEANEYYNTGADSYWDCLPWPVNPDHPCTRRSGIAQPDSDVYYRHVNQNWHYQCLACGALQPTSQGQCWHCGNTEDLYHDHFGTNPRS